MASLIRLIFSLMRSDRTERGMPVRAFSFQMTSNSRAAFFRMKSRSSSTYFFRKSEIFPSLTHISSSHSSSVRARLARTSRWDDVTPPLLAEASL